ncbi:hypothetical protein SLA2020_344290 [Shorea laevis]
MRPLPPPLPPHSESLAPDNGNSRLSKVLPTWLGPASILLMLVLYLIYTWIKNRTKPNEEDKGAEVDTFEGGFAGVKYDEVLEEHSSSATTAVFVPYASRNLRQERSVGL